MQLLESREAEGHRRQLAGIKLPIGGRDRHVTEHVGVELNEAAATEGGDGGDADEGKGAPVEGVARVGDGYRLLRRESRAERGSTLVEVSRTPHCLSA